MKSSVSVGNVFVKHLVFAMSLLVLLSCGGGGGDNPSPPAGQNPPPASFVPPPPEKASLFLQRATFGTTIEQIEELQRIGYEAWIDQQMSLPATQHFPYYQQFNVQEEDSWSQHVNAWWHRSITAPDQLRQRVAFALSQIWVVSQHGVSSSGVKGVSSLSNYYDILLEHSFGNYRNLMQDVTLSPVMGEYLSMLKNEKPNVEKNIRPDENYAREFMQLFTIGLVELNNDGTQKLDSNANPIPTYNQSDIEGLAHVFTGWTWGNAPKFKWWDQNRDLNGPMRAFQEYHAEGEKRIVNNGLIPAGQTAEQDLTQALDHIFQHPNIGPFLSKQLIQKLVTSNPSNEYVARVTAVFNNNGRGIRGDIGAVVKAILLDDEAINGVTHQGTLFGKVKEPILRLTTVWRAFDGKALNGQYDFRWVNGDFAQGPLQAHHVFNFYSPFYAPQGEIRGQGLVAPEMEIHTEGTIAKMTNHLHWRIISMNNLERLSPDADDIIINLDRERLLAESSTIELVNHLDLLLMGNKMSEQMRAILIEYLDTFDADRADKKAIEAVAMIVTSPEFAVQQ